MPAITPAFSPKQLGSALWWIKEVQSDGSDLATPDTFKKAYLKSASTWSLSQDTEEVNDEGGVKYSLSSSKSGQLTVTLLEVQADVINFLRDAFYNQKYFAIVVQRVGSARGGNQAGKYEYQYFPIAKLSSNIEAALPGTNLEVTFTLQAPNTDRSVTINSSGATADITDAEGTFASDLTLTCPANRFESDVAEVPA